MLMPMVFVRMARMRMARSISRNSALQTDFWISSATFHRSGHS
jgi:hypothetical protein